VKRYLKRKGVSYRRARRVPARQIAPFRQNVMRRALEKVRLLARRGVCDLFFGDESGFSLVPPVPYLWQERGKTVTLAAQGHQKRLNVLGFWKEEGQEEQALIHTSACGSLTSHHFMALVEEKLLPALRRPAVLVVDNARLHRCAVVEAARSRWKAQGLRLWFLPPYCPHLNRIETLWKRTKYHWLDPSAYADFLTLTNSVQNILNQIGGIYRLSFA
jgi:hypothetical protein